MSLMFLSPWVSQTLCDQFLFEKPTYNDYVADEESTYSLEVEMPGIKADDVSVNVQKRVLSIQAERKVGSKIREIRRTYRLPENINEEAIEAALSNGVLTITIPKGVNPESRRIEVQS